MKAHPKTFIIYGDASKKTVDLEAIKMKCLILVNGVAPKTAVLLRLVRTHDLFIATDGAANNLSPKIPPPDVILGDFDSMEESTREVYPTSSFVHTPDQDTSDIEKAIEHALDAGANYITLTGTLGGRIDHTLVSIDMLVKYSKVTEISIQEQSCSLFPVRKSAEIHGVPGDTLSLITFDAVSDVRLDGVRWPIRGETLLPSSHGVSNRMTGNVARVSIGSGVLIVCHIAA